MVFFRFQVEAKEWWVTFMYFRDDFWTDICLGKFLSDTDEMYSQSSLSPVGSIRFNQSISASKFHHIGNTFRQVA